MGNVFLEDKFGTLRSFKIAGEKPTEDEAARIQAHLTGLAPPKAAVEPPQDGILSALGKGLGRGVDTIQAGVLTGLQGIAETNDTGTVFGRTAKEFEEMAQEQRRQRDTILPTRPGGFLDQEGFYNKAVSLAGTAGESLPAMAGSLAAIIGGGMLGGPAGAVAGGVGSAAFYTPQLLNENAERQIQEHGYVKDWDKAAIATGAGAAVESLTDRITFGLAGVLKKPASALMHRAIKQGTDKALTIAAKRIGGAAAFSALSGAAEETAQAALARWQAEMPTGDEEAKAEYLESAVVGGILEGIFGAGVGVAGARSEIKDQQAMRDAIEDADAERATVAAARDANVPGHAAKRAAAYKDAPVETDLAADFKPAGLLKDRSAPTAVQKALDKEETALPPGLVEDEKDDREFGPHFTEAEYRDAVTKLRDFTSVSEDRIKTVLGIGRPKAAAIFQEILRRNDGFPAGSQNQYLKITVPKGLSTRSGANIVGRFDETRPSRDYIVRPVDRTDATPYNVYINGRKRGDAFQTEEDARAWAEALPGEKKFEIRKDTKGEQFGIYEIQYETDPETKQENIVGKRVVNTFSSAQEANEAIKEFDPAFSPESNRWKHRLTEEEKAARIAEDIKKELGPVAQKLQEHVDRLVGAGRAEAQVDPLLTGEVLAKKGVKADALPGPDAIVEGVTLTNKVGDALKRIVAVSADLTDPNATPEARQEAINAIGSHEVVHLMRDLDLLKPSEWQALGNYALTQKVPGKTYTHMQLAAARTGAKRPVDVTAEEGIAEMFRLYMKDPTAFEKPTRNILKKLADFIRKILGLTKRHGGEEVLRAMGAGEIGQRAEGSGGMPRGNYPGDPYFSVVRVDPFYSKADRFFSGLKQEKAPAKQWLGMMKNSGIKKAELDFLGLEDWLKAQDDKPSVSRGDILDYIRSHSLTFKEHKRTNKAPEFVPEDRRNAVATRMAEAHNAIVDQWQSLGNDAKGEYEAEAQNRFKRGFDLFVEEMAKEGDPAAVEFLEALNEGEIINEAASPAPPRWMSKTQDPLTAKDYTELAFQMEFLDPEFPPNSHVADRYNNGVPNVFAFTRFRTVWEDAKKVLFIEEIQSDLHQRGARYGYYSKWTRDRLAEIKAENARLNAIADEMRSRLEFSRHDNPDWQALQRQREKMQTLYRIYDRRSEIPDAPFKTSWEEYVLKRLFKLAVEQNFDYVAWHGQPESVAETEGYLESFHEVEQQVPTGHSSSQWARARRGHGDAETGLINASEAALEAGDTEAVAIFNKAIDDLQDAGVQTGDFGEPIFPNYIVDAIDPKVFDKYFPQPRGGKKFMVGDTNMTAIFNRYLEKLPRIAKQIGSKFDAVLEIAEGAGANDPVQEDPVQFFREKFVSKRSIKSLANKIANQFQREFGGRTDQEYYEIAGELDMKMRSAAQIAENQRNFDPASVFASAHILPSHVRDMEYWLETRDFDAVMERYFDEEANGGVIVADRDPRALRWKNYRLPITPALKEAFDKGDIPRFSVVEDIANSRRVANDPNFQKWFKNSVVNWGEVDDPDVANFLEPDDYSKPMVMYHGTKAPEDFSSFKVLSHFGTAKAANDRLEKEFNVVSGLSIGEQFGIPYKEISNWWSEMGSDERNRLLDEAHERNRQTLMGTRIYPAFLSIQNPIDIIDNGSNHTVSDYIKAVHDANVLGKFDTARLLMRNSMDALIKTLEEMGFDGFRYVNQSEDPGSISYAVFRPQQIKSVFNRGTWDRFDRRINYSMVEPMYSAAAPMGQRVPANTPVDRLNELEAKITYNNLAPVLQKLGRPFGDGPAVKSFEKGVENTLISFQDRMLAVGKLIDQMKKNGGFITNENDTYLRETLFSGKTDAMLQENDKNYYRPLIEAIRHLSVTDANAKAAAAVNDAARSIIQNYKNPKDALAQLYVYARHAKERNAEMRRRNEDVVGMRPNEYEHGSGMSDVEADEILAWFASMPFNGQFNDLSNPNSIRSLVRKLIANTNDIRVQFGLNPDFRTMTRKDGSKVDPYEDYVPLRSWIDEHLDDDEDVLAFAKAGKGFNIMGKEDFSAIGRKTLGSNVIEHAILQNEEAIVRAHKNEVAQSFLKLLEDNPEMMENVAEVLPRKRTQFKYNSKVGRVRLVADNSAMQDPTVLKVKVDGKQVYVKIKDERIARAMGARASLGNSGAGSLMKMLLGLNRFLAATRTSYNPEFMVSNMLRDLEAAIGNLSEYEQRGLRSEVVSNVFPALRGVVRAMRTGDTQSKWAKEFNEFKSEGGMTAFYGIRQLDDTIQKVNTALMEDLSGGLPTKAWKGVKAIGNLIEDWNLGVENGTRLASYVALRDRFLAMSGDPKDPKNIKRAKERAAFAAKNLTVNFNMGGELKPVLNALYLFYNAGLQGSMALLNPMIRSAKMRKVWAGIIVAGAVQDILNAMFSEVDDDGEKQYDKIPQHVLEHNIVLMDPFGISERGYWKIPLPYLMNGIYNAGRAISRGVRGEYSPGETFNSVGGTLAESLNPWGGANSFLNFVAPTIADPIVDLYNNENFADEPIAPPENPFGDKGKAPQRYWNNTSPAFVSIAHWMDRLTGGDAVFDGPAGFSPNQVEYVYEWLTGGTGTFLTRAFDLVSPVGGKNVLGEIVTGGEWSANDIPFARRAYGNITSKNDLQAYIEGRDEVLRVRSELRDALKDGDTDRYQYIMQTYPEEYRASIRINKIENARKKLSSQIKKVRENKKLSEEKKKETIDALKKKQDSLVGKGNAVLAGVT